MKRFVQGTDRTQGILLPEQLEDYVSDDNPVRVLTSSSIRLISDQSVSIARSLHGLVGQPITPVYCLKSTFTVISIVSSQAVVWSVKPNAISKSCG